MLTASQPDPPPSNPSPTPTINIAAPRDESEPRAPPSTDIVITSRHSDGSSGNHAGVLSPSQVERRRDFTTKLNLRRQAYRDLTVFQTFPLQQMAMESLDEQRRDYFNADQSDYDDDAAGSGTSTQDESSSDNLVNDDDDDDAAEEGGAASIGINTAANEPSSDSKERPSHQTSISHSKESDSQAQSLLNSNADSNEMHSPNKQPPAKKEGGRHCNNSQLLQSTLWSMEPRIFAMETAMKGKRRYISAHLGRFMDHYWRDCDVYNRHYYELIRENTPCRLYFDLEFSKQSNPEITPTITEDLLTDLFVELQRQFQQTYGISIQRSCVVDLDSSTTNKFSRHWILHLPDGQLFSDAREVGAFVKGLVSRLEEERDSGELRSRGHGALADNLLVSAEAPGGGDGPRASRPARFVDLGVYTRNRIFRLLGSTKFGKDAGAALRIAGANEFPFPRGFGNAKFYRPEMGRGPPGEDSRNDADDDYDFKMFEARLSFEDHAAAMSATLIVPANASKMNYPTLIDPSVIMGGDGKQQLASLRAANGSGTDAASRFPRATTKYGTSPFPKLEHFILNTLGKRKGTVGNIGTWSLSTQRPLPQMISFNMKDNRFCDNIGRAHRSNNIIWTVHLVDRMCWQSCHDPDCRGYRGNPIDLPDEANSEIDEYFLDYELSSLNESEVVHNKENERITPIGQDEDGISSAARENSLDDDELDDELARLNLSDILNYGITSKPLSEVKNQNDDFPGTSVHSKHAKSNIVNTCGTIDKVGCSVGQETETRATFDDEDFDDELARLNLSDIILSNCGSGAPCKESKL